MKENTSTIVSVAEAHQDFARVTQIAEKYGRAVIFGNDSPRYLVIDLQNTSMWDISDDEKIDVIAAYVLKRFKPAFEELAK